MIDTNHLREIAHIGVIRLDFELYILSAADELDRLRSGISEY